MRRDPAQAVALPLLPAGSQAAHLLASAWAHTSAPVRVRTLAATGHGDLGSPRACPSARGRARRGLRFACVV